MQKYGVSLDQLSGHALAAVQAAERVGARTLIYRDQVAVAAVVPTSDLLRLDPTPSESGEDPLLSLCGTCKQDRFVDGFNEDVTRTVLYRRD